MLFIYDIGRDVDSNKHDANENNEVGADNLMGALLLYLFCGYYSLFSKLSNENNCPSKELLSSGDSISNYRFFGQVFEAAKFFPERYVYCPQNSPELLRNSL